VAHNDGSYEYDNADGSHYSNDGRRFVIRDGSVYHQSAGEGHGHYECDKYETDYDYNTGESQTTEK
jgi:hypothetical protein